MWIKLWLIFTNDWDGLIIFWKLESAHNLMEGMNWWESYTLTFHNCKISDWVMQTGINIVAKGQTTISVRSPGLPGQRFMMLEYRVPVYRSATTRLPESAMQWINSTLAQATAKLPHLTDTVGKRAFLAFWPCWICPWFLLKKAE